MNPQQPPIPPTQSFMIIFQDGNVEMIRIRKDQCLHFAKLLANVSGQLIEMGTRDDQEGTGLRDAQEVIN